MSVYALRARRRTKARNTDSPFALFLLVEPVFWMMTPLELRFRVRVLKTAPVVSEFAPANEVLESGDVISGRAEEPAPVLRLRDDVTGEAPHSRGAINGVPGLFEVDLHHVALNRLSA